MSGHAGAPGGQRITYVLSGVVLAASLMISPNAPAASPPPPHGTMPPADTERYIAWMAKRGAPVVDTAHENVALRHGDWGFFSQMRAHQGPRDTAGLDRSGHVVTASDKGDWHAFLSSPGLDAAGALKRVAFLFRAGGIDPVSAPKVSNREKITNPTLETSADTVTFQGWLIFPPNMSRPMRLTIMAAPRSTKLNFESASKL